MCSLPIFLKLLKFLKFLIPNNILGCPILPKFLIPTNILGCPILLKFLIPTNILGCPILPEFFALIKYLPSAFLFLHYSPQKSRPFITKLKNCFVSL